VSEKAPEWDYSLFWKEAQNQIKQEISEQEFVMWFNVDYSSSSESKITVSVPSAFYKDQIIQRYLPLIETKIHELSGREIAVDFIVKKKKPEDAKTRADAQESDRPTKQAERPVQVALPKKAVHQRLRPEYSFENFVIGENNSFAANAANAIARNPGTTYNPYLLYGGVGLGKTHLMQAIGNYVYMTNDKAKVLCITAEEFTNEFIQSIQDKTTTAFKNRYRHVDVLLIDDIHFLQNKLGSQEELFHTFNALYDSGKQLVFTCDRPVSELKNLSDRLRSRFERGLNVDLQPPNYETRVAILKKKVEDKGYTISLEVMEIIAKNISTNVRDLEAALTRLVAYSDLVKKEISPEVAQQQLKDMFGQSKQGNVTAESIQKVVSEYFNLSFSDLRGKKKTKAIVFPRQLAMFITRDMTEYSTTEIGMEFGGRDHTTVMHACQKIEERKKTDPTLDSTIQKLIRAIKEYSTKA
jgi:chromosomal replication initiator protein